MRFSKAGFKIFTYLMVGALSLIYLWLIFEIPMNIDGLFFLGYWGVGIFTFLNLLETFSRSIGQDE